jgi:hypothetical protein
MRDVTAKALIAEATAIIERAETQRRDLSDFESGRVDALLEVADRVSSVNHIAPSLNRVGNHGELG